MLVDLFIHFHLLYFHFLPFHLCYFDFLYFPHFNTFSSHYWTDFPEATNPLKVIFFFQTLIRHAGFNSTLSRSLSTLSLFTLSLYLISLSTISLFTLSLIPFYSLSLFTLSHYLISLSTLSLFTISLSLISLSTLSILKLSLSLSTFSLSLHWLRQINLFFIQTMIRRAGRLISSRSTLPLYMFTFSNFIGC